MAGSVYLPATFYFCTLFLEVVLNGALVAFGILAATVLARSLLFLLDKYIPSESPAERRHELSRERFESKIDALLDKIERLERQNAGINKQLIENTKKRGGLARIYFESYMNSIGILGDFEIGFAADFEGNAQQLAAHYRVIIDRFLASQHHEYTDLKGKLQVRAERILRRHT
ncbi:MAG: hypothetical protein M1828_005531 [Chrysothrix sp. TS-e1954]|nr:MAG: hypothetical protein M1828_005531 [Chrysothrix sp. TS-e1954]